MYKIKLDQFEGPLDLLLFFIKRDELNIYDIPISRITKEFLEYVNLIKLMDLEIAGDFILMASTLMHIKVRMLLPKEYDERGEEIDPRADLIKALLEYKKYKEVAEDLSFFEANQRKLSFRGNFDYDNSVAPPEFDVLLKNISVYDLTKAFKKAIEGIKPAPVHQIRKVNVSIEEMIELIITRLKTLHEIHFLSLIHGMQEKIRVVTLFIAILELVKSQSITIKTTNNFNDFVLSKVAENG